MSTTTKAEFRLMDLKDGSGRAWLTDGANFGMYADAAPEMLEALMRGHLYFLQCNNLSADDRDMLDEMWAAIQKAKGAL